MILLLILVFIRYYIDRGRLLFCPCSGCQAASLTELGVGYAWENSPLRLVKHCDLQIVNKCVPFLVPAVTEENEMYGVVEDHYQYEKDEYDTKIKENNEYYEDEDDYD